MTIYLPATPNPPNPKKIQPTHQYQATTLKPPPKSPSTELAQPEIPQIRALYASALNKVEIHESYTNTSSKSSRRRTTSSPAPIADAADESPRARAGKHRVADDGEHGETRRRRGRNGGERRLLGYRRESQKYKQCGHMGGPCGSARQRKGTSVGTDQTSSSPPSTDQRCKNSCAARQENTQATDSNSVI